jgi:general secretion pathway protein I
MTPRGRISPRGRVSPRRESPRRFHLPRRRALSLLEVTLAIAILGGSLAVIGELVRLGSRQAEEARELTTAQLLCESKMEEIVAGILAPQAVSYAPFDDDPRWSYSIDVASLDVRDLIQVTVTVEQAEVSREVPLTFSLTRWMLDPDVEAELMDSSFGDGASGMGTFSSGSAPSGGIPGSR